MLELVKSAKNKIYFQNQYIKPRENCDPLFSNLINELINKSQDPKIDCRIILRGGYDDNELLSSLKAVGFEM